MRRVHRHHPSAVDDDDAIRDLAHFGKNVRGEKHGVLASEGRDQIADFDALFRVEARRRLVEDQDRRLVHDRLREADALLESFGERADALACDVAEIGSLQRAIHGRRSPGARNVLDLRDEPEELTDGELRVERRVLRQVSDPPLGVDRPLQQVVAVDRDRPSARRQVARHHPHRRRLAGPVWPQEAEHLPGADLEREVVDGGVRAKTLGQMLDGDHRSPGIPIGTHFCRGQR